MNDFTLTFDENLHRLQKFLAIASTSADLYNVYEPLGLDRDKQSADPDDEWTHAFIIGIDGNPDPSLWILVEDIRESRLVKSGGYVISLAKDKFLKWRLLA